MTSDRQIKTVRWVAGAAAAVLVGSGAVLFSGLVGPGNATTPATPSAELHPVKAIERDGQDADTNRRPVSFNDDIRPILSDKCFACHGFDRNTREAGLRLDDRDAALAEHDTGRPIVPGDPDASSLIQRITSDNDNRVMPPPHMHKPVTDDQVALLRRWIEEGAAYEPHWAYQGPLKRPLPQTRFGDWVRNDIDRFVAAKLEAEGMRPSPEADRRTLIRRVYLDLIGLPPTPEQVEAFVTSEDPDAYEKLVDELLASEHFGERMALPWLDAARYADSNSYQFDNDRWAWPWRDWLVKQINANRRFDDVIIEMLAGDLLPGATQDQRLATAFNRHHFLNAEGGAIAEEVRFNYVLDRVETTSTTFLGLTYACAQCHDHKYDPISIENYYEFFALFGQVDENGRGGKGVNTWDFRYLTAEPTMSIATEAQQKERARLKQIEDEAFEAFGGKDALNKVNRAARDWARGLSQEQMDALPPLIYGLVGRSNYGRGFQAPMQEPKLRDYYANHAAPQDADWLPAYRAWIEAQKARMDQDGAMPIIMVMRDREQPRDIRVRDRGLYSAPIGEPVQPGLPEALGGLPEDLPRNRLGFAKWLVSEENPLTARVLVNRLWQQVFGMGIVKTPEDFGLQGAMPSHPGLLDYLAVKYRTDWDTKAIMRQIVTSATYRQASAISPDMLEADPENKLLARGPRFRMPAMLIRDQALAASGLLNDEMFGPPVYPYQPDRLWVDVSFAMFEYKQSEGEDLYRRSLYTFFRRTLAPPNLFDNANRQACTVKPSITNTPLQALTLLNDPTYVEAARALALRVSQEKPGQDADALIGAMFERVLLRPAEAREMQVLETAYQREYDWYKQRPGEASAFLSVGQLKAPGDADHARLAALSSVALTILNTDEAMTKE